MIARKYRRAAAARAIVGVVALLFLGCGTGGREGLAPVTGVVRLDGEPTADLIVNFIPQGNTEGPGAHGITAADGRYVMSTLHDGAGVVPGEYRVTVVQRALASTLPPRFASPAESVLRAAVTEAGGDIDFDIQSK